MNLSETNTKLTIKNKPNHYIKDALFQRKYDNLQRQRTGANTGIKFCQPQRSEPVERSEL